MADWETSGKDGGEICRLQLLPPQPNVPWETGLHTQQCCGTENKRGREGTVSEGGHQPSTIFRCSRRRHVVRYSFHLISDGIPLNTLSRVHKHRPLGASCKVTFASGCVHVSVGSSSPSRLNLGRLLLEGWLCAAPGAQWAQLSSAVTEAPSARVSLSPHSSFVPPPFLFLIISSASSLALISALFFHFVISLLHQTASGLVVGAAGRGSVL